MCANLTFAQRNLRVTVTNNAPDGGTYITPVWFGFHNGSFDSYNGGAASAPELERLAEDGNFGPLADTFAAGGTLIGNGQQNGANRLQRSLGAAPLGPGATASQIVTVSGDGENDYFTYASMILPSSDYYISNGNPFAFDVSGLTELGDSLSFDVFQVNDAGTEINDFSTSAGNGFFGNLLGPGQNGPNQGADENGVNANVLDPFAGFLNAPLDADIDPQFAQLDFNNRALYPNGIATITITAVPEPGSFAALTVMGTILFARRRRGA